MALWLVRTGSHGEHEDRFIEDGRIYLTWDGLKKDLSKLKVATEFREVQQEYYPGSKPQSSYELCRTDAGIRSSNAGGGLGGDPK